MPSYTFQCEKCGKIVVLYPRMTSPKEHQCQCGKKAKRIIEVPYVKYVGNGFASVDAEQEKRYKEAVDISNNVYTKRAEPAPKASDDPQFWQDLANIVGD